MAQPMMELNRLAFQSHQSGDVYTGNYTIPQDAPTGRWDARSNAIDSLGNYGEDQKYLYVHEAYKINLVSDKPAYTNTEIAKFNATVFKYSSLVFTGFGDSGQIGSIPAGIAGINNRIREGVTLELSILDESDIVKNHTTMANNDGLFQSNIDLTGYAKGNYTARVNLTDVNGASVSTSLEFKVTGNFEITVNTDKPKYNRTESVLITGKVIPEIGSSANNVNVKLALTSRGFTRTFETFTGEDGSYEYQFDPMPDEAGLYTLAASATINDLKRTKATEFEILGLKVIPSTINVKMSKNSGNTIPITIRNLGQTSLTGITAEIIDHSNTDGVTATITRLPVDPLSPGGSTSFDVLINAAVDSANTADFDFIVRSTETVETGLISTSLFDATTVARLDPSPIKIGIHPGGFYTQTVNLSNIGFGTLRNVTIVQPVNKWISAEFKNGSNILAGESMPIDVTVNPNTDVPEGVYNDELIINSDNHPRISLYFEISVTSSQMGNFIFHVTNDQGDLINGARISLQNQLVMTEIYSGITNADGNLNFNDLPAGRYSYILRASGYDTYSNSETVEPGLTKDVEPVLPTQMLGVKLTVVPITIQDEYSITLNLTFETDVPPPILMPAPLYIEHSVNVCNNIPDYSKEGMIKIYNEGLISIFNLSVDANMNSGGLTFPTGTSSIDFEKIKGKSDITIPYQLTAPSIATPGYYYIGKIDMSGDFIYFEPKSDVHHNRMTRAEIPVFLRVTGCSAPSGGPGGYFGSGGGGGGGGGYSYSPPSIYIPDQPIPPQPLPVETVHERVKLSLSQRATLERDAFAASLELTNKLTDTDIKDINVTLKV
jgi:uncharacterized membrane protein